MSEEYTASLFMNGGSQAVRLPKECRFSGVAVRVRRIGSTVILEPLEKPDWPVGYWERLTSLPGLPDDVARPEDIPSPDRERALDDWAGA